MVCWMRDRRGRGVIRGLLLLVSLCRAAQVGREKARHCLAPPVRDG